MAKKLRPGDLHDVARRFGEKTDEHARKQLDQQLRSAIGVPLSSIERPVQDRIGGWVATNVSLIVTVPERYFDRLQEDVQVAFAAGTRPEALAAELEDRYAMSERDAQRVARDQVLKLSADVNQARMQSIGIERGIWRIMRDERVSPDCRALEGQEYELSSGVGGIFPGKRHPQCRCYCEPVLEGLFDRLPVRGAA